MALDIRFGTYDMNSVVTDFKPKSDNRIKETIIPRKDGAHIDEGLLRPMTISLTGWVIGTSQTDFRTKLDAFLKAITAGKQNLYLWDDRYVVAQKKTLDYDYGHGTRYMKYRLVFVADTPFWIAVDASQDIEVCTESPHSYSLTAEQVIGNAYAKPIITFKADQGVAITSIAFENLTTEEKFSYVGTVTSTKSLVIDCGKFTVENDEVDDIANFSGDFMRLISGANSRKYTGSNCTITIDWINRWY